MAIYIMEIVTPYTPWEIQKTLKSDIYEQVMQM